jgi:hypothetical protein
VRGVVRGGQLLGRWLRVFTLLALILGYALHSPRGAVALCTGDCSGNGSVTIDELLKMVNIALGSLSVHECDVGDTSGDGRITIDEIVAAVRNALAGCPPPVVLRISSATGAPGQRVSFSVTVDTANALIDLTQNQITFDPNARIASTASGEPDCTGPGATAFLPPGCVPSQDCQAIRGTFATERIRNGAVAYTCNVDISTSATVGSRFTLHCSAAIFVDENIEQFPADCEDGEIVVTQP